jgi:GTP cyclohydrolase II
MENEDKNSVLFEFDWIYLKKLRTLEWNKPWIAIEHAKRELRKRGGLSNVVELGRAPLPTDFGDWTYIVFGDWTTGQHHEILAYGNLDKGSLGDGKDVLMRLHCACRTNEVYSAVNCECKDELQMAMQLIREEGRGLILYLDQEGRGAGIVGKLAQLSNMFGWENGRISQKFSKETGERVNTYEAYEQAGFPSEARDFSIAGEMLRAIGVSSLRLLTNNPKKIKTFQDMGFFVKAEGIHIEPVNPTIANDLKSKAEKGGHSISPEHYAYGCEAK